MSLTDKLSATYTPADIEKGIYEKWEQAGYFAPTLDKDKAFSIVLPPPNVTGSLHMGHGFNNAIMDALIRHHRMKGYDTLWQGGTDHAGIATQMVVERQLGLQGVSRHDLGREKFLEKVWQWKEASGGTITSQIRRLGSSVDWSRERFTMDDELSDVVKEVFVRLYDEGLIYRKKRLVNWDIKLQTAISDLEVENRDEKGFMYHVRYPFVAGQTDANGVSLDGQYMHIATTRPETILADGCLAVHPDDERYTHILGKMVHVPLTDRVIPVLADPYPDPEFGTGCVKITPAHDFNDYEVGERHDIEIINLMNLDGTMNENCPPAYRGLDRFDARKAIISDLETYEFLEKVEPHELKRPYGDRSGVVIEPLLTDQWYVKIAPLAEPAIKAVENGDIKFVPEQYTNMYMAWMREIKDWCISRQLWWGHRIPAWYNTFDENDYYVATSELEAYLQAFRYKYDMDIFGDKLYRSDFKNDEDYERYEYIGNLFVKVRMYLNEKQKDPTITNPNKEQEFIEKIQKFDISLRQDDDVLDTWFSSALWTFSTLGWKGTDEDFDNQILKKFHPTSVLVTGFDIIFFWVARMIMMTLHFVKDKDGKAQVPFKTVYVHGLVRDSEGAKMSKSKGNVLDPLDLINGIDLESLVAKRTTGLMNPKDANKIEKATRKEFADGIPAFGTDALRFTFCALASTGRDIKFDLKRIEGYRNFCNKIYNATRFVLMNVDGKNIHKEARPELWELPEQWIISRLQKCEQAVNLAFETYRLDLASQAIYDFIWNEYCDWYVELTKPVLNDDNVSDDRKAQVRFVLLSVMEVALRLTHPIMPFITEELWQTLAPLIGRGDKTIMLAPYPIANDSRINEQAENDMAWLQGLIGAVRNIRGEMNLGNGKLLPVLLQNINDSEKEQIKRIEPLFKALAKVESLAFLGNDEKAPLSSSSVVGSAVVLVPMKGLIDPTAELARLNKELDKLTKQYEQIKNKLANEAFVAKAPASVVEAERAKLAELEGQIGKVRESVGEIESL